MLFDHYNADINNNCKFHGVGNQTFTVKFLNTDAHIYLLNHVNSQLAN